MRERKPEVPLNQSTARKVSDTGTQRASASGTMIHTSSESSARKDANHIVKQEIYHEEVCHSCLLITNVGHNVSVAHILTKDKE